MRHFLALLILVIISCKPTSNRKIIDSSLQNSNIGGYISEYTNPSISLKEDLVFRMSSPVIEASEVGTVVDNDLYAITPKIGGKAYWKNESTLVFTPEDHFQYGTEYNFKLKLGSIFEDVPKEFKVVNFPFKTRDISFEMRNLSSVKYVSEDENNLSIQGRINSSDYVPNETVEDMLSANQKGNDKIDIIWNHSNGGYTHRFEITGLERREKPSEVDIEWRDKKYGTGFNGKRTMTVYAKDAFEVVSAEVAKGNDRKITLSFTGTLDRSQNLEGLIKIRNYKGGFKYDIIGSIIHVYPEQKVISPFSLIVNKAVVNKSGDPLAKNYSNELSFDPIKPGLKLAGNGVIVPHNDEIIFPFEAINLKGAKVEILKIFSDNVLQFLQYNRLNTTYSLNPVGRIVHQEDIKLTDINSDRNDANYVRYALDLSKMIDPDPGAIYQVRIGFDKSDVAAFHCDEKVPKAVLVSQRDGFTSIMNTPEGYNWSDRDDPCKSSYYNSSRFISRNMLGSNIGIIAKRTRSNEVSLILSDLRTVQPIQNATVKFYDFQQQEISSTTSGTDGISTAQLEEKPAFAIITHGGDFGYINLQDQHANSLSEFEVSGKSKKKGLDGFIYGERGVWRPGDTLFLNFEL